MFCLIAASWFLFVKKRSRGLGGSLASVRCRVLCVFSMRFPILLVLGIVGVGFYFQDLLGVAFTVSGDEENKLIAVQLCA